MHSTGSGIYVQRNGNFLNVTGVNGDHGTREGDESSCTLNMYTSMIMFCIAIDILMAGMRHGEDGQWELGVITTNSGSNTAEDRCRGVVPYTPKVLCSCK